MYFDIIDDFPTINNLYDDSVKVLFCYLLILFFIKIFLCT